jgi:hypothetical protein
MAPYSTTEMTPLELAAEYRDALTRAATASRQAALLARILAARGVTTLKGDEPAEVDSLLLDAGRRSLEAREALVIA